MVRATLAIGLSVATISAGGTSSAPAASTASTIGAEVLTATNLDVDGCAAGVAGSTDFGLLTTSQTSVGVLGCDVEFGSSNASARLSVRQTDGAGRSMWQYANGTLDTGFDTDGRRTVAVAPGAGWDQASEVRIQQDGKVVLFGECNMGGANGYDMCVVRLLPDGTPDPAFGTAGIATATLAPGASQDQGRTGLINDDGTIVVAGGCVMPTTSFDLCLAAFRADGTPELSFGTAGTIVHALSGGTWQEVASAIEPRPNGGYLVSVTCNGTNSHHCVLALHADGSIDSSFGAGGMAAIAVGIGGTTAASDIAVDGAGRIAVGGICSVPATGFDGCVERLLPTGAIDTDFSIDGKTEFRIAPGTNADRVVSIAIGPDGLIVAAGYCDMGATGSDFCIARYAEDGSLDPTFSDDGIASVAVGGGAATDVSYDVRALEDGRIVMVGGCNSDLCMVMFRSDGTLDTNFSGDGVATLNVGTSDAAWSIAPSIDGRLLMAGYCSMGATGMDMCVTQFSGAGQIDDYVVGVRDWNTAGTNAFAACLDPVSSGVGDLVVNTGCPLVDGPGWSAISGAPVAVAHSATGEVSAIASLRFGIRTSATQASGAYVAPITFDVLAS